MTAWFYRFEARGIQPYVLGGSRLHDVVGASALVEAITDLGDGDSPGLLGYVLRDLGHDPEKIVQVRAAGGATLRFEKREDLRRFAGRWPMEVELFAPGLTLVQACVPDQPAVQTTLHRQLEVRRSFVPPALPVGTPVIERGEGGTRPAWGPSGRKGSEGTMVDHRTWRAEWAGRTLRDDLERRLCGEAADALELPRDLERISGADAHEYLAVIHADGNAVGARVEKITELEPYRAFADALAAATLAAARKATTEALQPDRGREAPGRPIVIGGDDITVVVRADRALDFVEVYCREFEHQTAIASEALGGGLTASAGVAFVRRRHPFRLAYDLAASLCDRAKHEGKRVDALHPPSLVAFHRHTTSFGGLPEDDDQYRGTMGPYLATAEARQGDFWPLGAIRRLGGALALRDVPRGPIRELARVLHQAPERARQRYARVAEVQAQARGDLWRRRVLPGLDALAPDLRTEPWLTATRAGRSGPVQPHLTPWLDALTVAVVEGTRGLPQPPEEHP